MNNDTQVTHKIPEWYGEIFPAGPRDGFFHKFGEHAASFVDRGEHQLVISFDNLSDAGFPDTDIKPWAENFVRDNGWSHLGVYSRGPSWYRDARLIRFLEWLRDDGFFTRFERVTLIGTSMGGFAALAFAQLIPGANVVSLSPQTTLDKNLVPWEVRFQKGQVRDWTLPYSDAAEGLDQAGKVYVIYDKLLREDKAQADRLPQDKIIALNAIGCGHKSAVALRRMEQLKPVMKLAITGELTEASFYQMMRSRRNILFYRKVLESHLEARGRADRIPAFRRAFKVRRRQILAAEGAQVEAASSDPAPAAATIAGTTSAPVPPVSDVTEAQSVPPLPRRTGAYPRTRANAWMITEQNGGLAYLSDQYENTVIGFEERNGKTLAQTPPVALGMLTYGGQVFPDLPFAEDGRFHVVDENLDGAGPLNGARAIGVCDMLQCRDAGLAGRTVLALTQNQPGITAAEALPGSDFYQAFLARVKHAVAALEPWGKPLFIDRIALRLLSAAPQVTEAEADQHYSDVMKALRRDLTQITGQGAYPAFVVCQSGGTRTDGTSQVILSEARLALDNPTLNVIVATPAYPFELMEDMPATHSARAQMQITELETLALRSTQDGQAWHCPQMIYAGLRDEVVTADFSTLSRLELQDGAHGFAISGCENGAKIASVRVAGDKVQVVLDKKPEGKDLRLNYAWGQTADGSGNHLANQGALTDSWQAESKTCPGETLRRYALSASVKIFESHH